jgi:predicted permease
MFTGLRDRAEVFSGVTAWSSTTLHMGDGDATEELQGALVSGEFFELLGLQPAVGRLLTREDDRTPGAHPVAVLGHGFWSRRFAADRSVVGRTVKVNGVPMVVAGVAPAGFHGVEVGESHDVFVPLAMQNQVMPTWPNTLGDWRSRWLVPLARLAPGVDLTQASAGAQAVYRQLLAEDLANAHAAGRGRSERFQSEFAQKTLVLLPGGGGASSLRAQAETPLVVLMGLVGLVLLITCANVANLLLARSAARQREMAVRLALGASRGRLVRQLLVESLLLGLAGGTGGLVFAAWTGEALLAALPFERARFVLASEPDLRVGLFAFALSVATGIAFGLVPALQSARPELAPTLKSEAGTLAGGRGSRFRRGLVVAQVALSLLLLVGAGLFTRSLINLRSLDPGFESRQLLALTVNPALNGYPLEQRQALLRRIHDDLSAEPGVRSVGLAELALMTDSNWSNTVKVEGYEPQEGENMNPFFNGVSTGFFATLGQPLVAGRDLADADVLGAPKVAVVNEVFARYFFPQGDAVGRRFGYGRSDDEVEIVGVVRDGLAATLREEPRRAVYVPWSQAEDLHEVTFYVRSDVAPDVLAERLRAVVRQADPGLPVSDLQTLDRQIVESLFVERLVAALSAAFGVLATLLAGLGLYGVMSHAVALRSREIGVRVALGARRRDVLLLVLGEVALLAGSGVLLGLPGGYGLGRLVEAQLYGVGAADAATFQVAIAVLLLASCLAGYLPAARAARVDPMRALRNE